MKTAGILLSILWGSAFALLDFAQAAPIKISGLSPEDSEIMMATLKPRLEFIDERPATPYRANDAAYLLERQLLREGYYEAVVNSELINGGTTILLKVNSGARYTIGEVVVRHSGPQEIDLEAIEGYFLQPVIDRELVKRDNIPYLEDYRFEGATNSENYLRSIGYWKAQTTVSEPHFNRQTKKVDFKLHVSPGPLHQLATPRLVVPPSAPSSEELQSKLSALAGETSTSKTINELRTITSEFYRHRGFEFADIAIRVEHRNGRTFITVEVDPGERYRVGKPKVFGLEETEPHRVRRPFNELRGELYNRDKIDKVVSQLLQTGAFESIRAEGIPADEDGVLNLEIEIREAKARGYTTYFGAGTFQGLILGAGYYDRNFRGKMQNFSTRVEVSGLGVLGEVKLVEPFFLGENIAFSTRLYVQERTFEEYDKSETGFGFELDYDFTDKSRIHVFSDITYNNISAGSLPPSSIGQETYIAATLGVEQKFDFRNNPALPTKGFYTRGLLSITEIFGEDDNLPFAKAELAASYYNPVSDTLRIAAGVEAGAIFPLGDRQSLPIDERYFIGGADSVRSFRWRDLGPRPANSAVNQSVGGEAYWTASLEVQQQLVGPLWGVAFTDAGALSPRMEDLANEEIEVAVGLGLRLNLPIGPVRLEYAKNMTQDPGEPSGSWHFAIGVAF